MKTKKLQNDISKDFNALMLILILDVIFFIFSYLKVKTLYSIIFVLIVGFTFILLTFFKKINFKNSFYEKYYKNHVILRRFLNVGLSLLPFYFSNNKSIFLIGVVLIFFGLFFPKISKWMW